MKREELKKRVEYMLLSKNEYNIRLDIYVTEEYDDEYENIIGYKLQYIQNDLGLEIVGPAKCLVPFWMVDNKEGEKQEIIEEYKKNNKELTNEEVEDIWFDRLDEKILKRIEELKVLFRGVR